MFGVGWCGIIHNVTMKCDKDSPIEFVINNCKVPKHLSNKVLNSSNEIEKHFAEIDKLQLEIIRILRKG